MHLHACRSRALGLLTLLLPLGACTARGGIGPVSDETASDTSGMEDSDTSGGEDSDTEAPGPILPEEGDWRLILGAWRVGGCRPDVMEEELSARILGADPEAFTLERPDLGLSWACSLGAGAFDCPKIVVESRAGGGRTIERREGWRGRFSDSRSFAGALRVEVACIGSCQDVPVCEDELAITGTAS